MEGSDRSDPVLSFPFPSAGRVKFVLPAPLALIGHVEVLASDWWTVGEGRGKGVLWCDPLGQVTRVREDGERRGGGCVRMGEPVPLGAPVPVEQAVLETFFSHLGIFSYDKAKDNVEKEREGNKSAGASWLALLAALAHLAAAEKAYHSMTFLGQKLGTPPRRRRAAPAP